MTVWGARLLTALFSTALLVGCQDKANKSTPGQAQPVSKNAATNVILISLDTTRRDHLSIYGHRHNTTPRLAQLAEGSLVFDRAVAVSNWTLPTHASMLTGVYPRTHGARWVNDDLPHLSSASGSKDPKSQHVIPHVSPAGIMADSATSVAEVLKARGYATGAVLANFAYLYSGLGLNQGFDHYDDRPGRGAVGYRRAQEITSLATAWLAEHKDTPHFLFLNYIDPHAPYTPPAPFDTKFAEGPNPFPEAVTVEARSKLFFDARDRVNEKRVAMLPDEARALGALYDGEIAYMDHQIGRLIDWLKTRGMYEQALIVIVGDHGESLGEHGVMGHAFSMYEAEVAVPLLVKFPRSHTVGRRDYLVSQLDIFPTVLKEVGYPVPPGLPGQLLTASTPRTVVADAGIFVDFARRWPWLSQRQMAVYTDAWKFISYGKSPPELYNLIADPNETDNVAKTHSQEVPRFRRIISQWKNTNQPLAGSRAAEVDPEREKQLRSLGYVGD